MKISTRALCAASIASLVTTVAHAEPSVCHFQPTATVPSLTCSPPVTCVTRATCITAPDSADETCQPVTSAAGVTSRECLHDCTTLFGCGVAADCPTMPGVTAGCQGTVIANLPAVCVYTAPTGALPLDAQITYCTTAGNHIGASEVAACHTLPGTMGMYTDDWFRGDCDRDGCENGYDTNPCAAAPGNCMPPSTMQPAPVESPFCAPLPAYACTFNGSQPVCGDARPCDPSAASILPCPIGSCEDGWAADGPRCRPPCGTLFFCATGPSDRPEQCPTLVNGGTGVCEPLPMGTSSPVRGRDGVCIYTTFFDSSCLTTMSSVGLACFQDATTGALQPNFFAGDCDGDHDPNGCDHDAVCDATMRGDQCMNEPGMGCTPTYTPPDAGVDAAADDAGADDAAVGDAASSIDASGSNVDVGPTFDRTLGFGGGGGCRCVAAGASRGSPIAALVLAFVLARRSRRGGTLHR